MAHYYQDYKQFSRSNCIVDEFIILYIIFHLPAIILLILGLNRLKTKPEKAKTLLIFAGLYFLIGAGICGAFIPMMRQMTPPN